MSSKHKVRKIKKLAIERRDDFMVDDEKTDIFVIPYPIVLLIASVLLIYFKCFSFGVTELDDTIFIRDFHEYNENLSNLWMSFQRGLFDAVKDPYYRPLFMDSMILNHWISNHGQNIAIYHIINVLLHCLNVVLLYKLFLKLKVTIEFSFILSIIFAVHPVLTQAVAWIPGRNDTILATFVILFLIQAIKYTNSGKLIDYCLSLMCLLLAFFTKETAVFAAPAAFMLLVVFLKNKIVSKPLLLQYLGWLFCFALWYIARSKATVQLNLNFSQFAGDFLHRLPLVVQYLGKIVLPVNLSVFPMQDETVYYYGILAVICFAVLLYMSKNRDLGRVIAGFSIFFLFLLPALIVPTSLNEQTFEHRLYLPLIGILLVVPETFLFSSKFSVGQIIIYSLITAALLAITTINHENNFKDPLSFWTQAVETSPRSSFANMHLSEYEDDLDKKCALIRKAYQLNKKEKYINFFYAEMLINTNKKDSIIAAEPYLTEEKKISNFHKCDFYLGRVAVEKGDLYAGIEHLLDFLKTEPGASKEGGEANNNLLVLYINTHQADKVVEQVKKMKQLGLNVPPEVYQMYHLN